MHSNTVWKCKVAELRFSSVCEVTDYILWMTRVWFSKILRRYAHSTCYSNFHHRDISVEGNAT